MAKKQNKYNQVKIFENRSIFFQNFCRKSDNNFRLLRIRKKSSVNFQKSEKLSGAKEKSTYFLNLNMKRKLKTICLTKNKKKVVGGVD